MATVSPRHTIERLGYKVTGADGQTFNVKLPLLCSLRVAAGEKGEYSITPYFGFVRRSTATWTAEAIYVGLLLILLWADLDNPKLVVALFAVILLGMVHDVYRYVLTEAAMTRISISLMPGRAA